MLDEAGYPRKGDGKRFTVRVSYDKKQGPLGPASKLMRIQLSKIGVDVKIMAMDSGAWRDTAFKNWDFDITLGSFSTGPDPAIGTERLYVCRNVKKLFARNASGYCNPKLDELFAAASKELNEEKRVAYYRDAMGILTEDVPHLWLWDRHYPLAFKADLLGLPADPTQYGPFDAVSWK
jgi:peptide/nickel transport system substrate-binding protein